MEQVLIHSLRKYGHALILLLFSCQAKLDGDITTQNPSDPALSPENIQTTTSKDTSETDYTPEVIVNNPETTNNTSNDPTPNSDPGPQVLALTLSDFSVSSVNYNSFDVSFNFLGDDNSNSTVQIYYCSVKQKFACDPKTDGVAGVLNKSSQKYNLVVDISAAPFSPGDVLKYEILATDADGLTGGQEYGEITIPFDISTPRSVGQLGYLDFGKDASNTEEVYTSTIDSFGNMYIAGHTKSHLNELNTSSQDAFIAKINNSGDIVWVSHLGMTTLGSAASGDEQVNDITLDSNGNIYIAGATSGSLGETNAGSSDGFVAKFDSNGKVIWIKQLGNITVGANASASDSLKAIAINSSEEIYVTGMSLGNLGETNGGNSDIIAAKLDSDGNLIWLKQLGQTTLGVTAPSGFEDAHDIKIDSIGDVYITGETGGDLADTNGGLLYDIYIAKLTSAGNLAWIKQLGNSAPPGIDSSNIDYAYGLALDSSDNIYVTGTTFGSLAETKSGGYDTYVIKFDSSGNLSWARQLGNTTIGANANAEDVGEDIAIDSSGNIFITGYTSSALGESSAGLIDIYLAKFNNAGTFQWVKQLGNTTIGSSGNNNDYSKSISIDSSGSLYIGGYTASSLGEASGGSSDAYAAKFDSMGTLTWLKQLGYTTIGGGSSNSETSNSIVLDASGNIYMAGETQGSLSEPSGGSWDVYVAKYDSNRNLTWVKQLGATTIGTGANTFDFVTKIALDNSNNIYITGQTLGELNGGIGGGSFDAYVAKFNNSGSLLWVTQLDPTLIGAGANNVEYSYDLVVDSSGNAYITGGTQGSLGETNGGFEDAYAAKIDTNG
ncbi:MAG: SBBP repeat-containing protein, partial [Bdellovibrionota bacterium]